MVLLNPGTGRVHGATKRAAQASLRRLLKEAGVPGAQASPLQADGGGRYSATLRKGRRRCDVSIPGVSVAALTSNDAFPPRLYVNGSSWWWEYAVESVRESLLGNDG